MDEVTITITIADVHRIFQALAQETRRLASLRSEWRDDAETEHTRRLRDEFAILA